MNSLNDLERLLRKPKFGPESYPELFRLLRESKLAFLLPYHPEMEGSIGLKNGDSLPPFVVWKNPQDGCHIPIFTSLERAQEACAKTRSRAKQYVICEMLGRELFHLLSVQEHPITLNPATSMPVLFLDLNGVKAVARVRKSNEDQPEQQGRVQLLTAADYPTDLVQALFQYFRQCPEVQAAWISKLIERTEPGTVYVLLTLATGERKKLQDATLIVAGSACKKGETMHMHFIEPGPSPFPVMQTNFPPFYAAPNYKTPNPLGEE